MKTVLRHSYLLLLLLPLFLSHCGKASEPTPAQVVTIADMWVGNLTDYDQDGYYSFFNLYFDLNVNRESKEVFVLLAIRFYDSADTATYYELFTTESFTIEGNSSDDALFVDVELPSNAFPAAGYDFLFLVFDSNDPIQRLAELSATDQELLSNVPLEHIDNDVAVTIGNMWISDTVDTDGDGYYSSFHLNFDLNATGGSKEVFVMLARRFYDPNDTEPYIEYFTSADFTVTGNELDVKYFIIPISEADFSQAGYDFLFIVFDSSDPEVRWVEVSAGTSPMLRNFLIEPTETDNKIWIYDAWFEDEVDLDEDGYNSQAMLVLDVDEENGPDEDVYVDISYRTSGTTTYMSLGTTEVFTVTREDYDPIGIEVTKYHNFNHGSYDFKIDLKFDGYNIIEDWMDASTDSDLSGVQLELASDEQELSVWDAWLSNVFDNDSDSYYYWVIVTIDIDVDIGETDVLLRPGYKLSNESVYTFSDFTDTLHVISGSHTDDESYIFKNFNYGIYDISFEISFLGSDVVQLVYDATDDPDLANIRLENWSQDGRP